MVMVFLIVVQHAWIIFCVFLDIGVTDRGSRSSRCMSRYNCEVRLASVT